VQAGPGVAGKVGVSFWGVHTRGKNPPREASAVKKGTLLKNSARKREGHGGLGKISEIVWPFGGGGTEMGERKWKKK